MQLTKRKKEVKSFVDKIAARRDQYIRQNKYYYQDLQKFLEFNVLPGKKVLEVGCGTGDILHYCQPKLGVGIDISRKVLKIAREKYPQYQFKQMDAEDISIYEKFDYIIISDTLGYIEDIQRVFNEIKKLCHADTRLIITYHNFMWQGGLELAERLGLKMPQVRLNWLGAADINNLLYLEDFDVIRNGKRFLAFWNIPFISWLINKYLANLPFINQFCITQFTIARHQVPHPPDNKLYKVSVVIPARNEKGNIENAIKRLPLIGKETEIIFIEGHSTDGTLDEIERVAKKYRTTHLIKVGRQDGKGKGDAVRQGFSLATGDILMILDADLTVPPEDLPKFYNAIATGKGEYINGTRLVYPMEGEAMRTLNLFGNKFFSIVFSWLLNQRMKDTLCGTKVMSRVNWQKLQENRHYFGDFDPFGDFDMIFGAAKLNLKFVEVPIRYRNRIYGETNISRFKHGWLLLKMVWFALGKIKFV